MLDETRSLPGDLQAWLTEMPGRIAEHRVNNFDALPPRASAEARAEVTSRVVV